MSTVRCLEICKSYFASLINAKNVKPNDHVVKQAVTLIYSESILLSQYMLANPSMLLQNSCLDRLIHLTAALLTTAKYDTAVLKQCGSALTAASMNPRLILLSVAIYWNIICLYYLPCIHVSTELGAMEIKLLGLLPILSSVDHVRYSSTNISLLLTRCVNSNEWPSEHLIQVLGISVQDVSSIASRLCKSPIFFSCYLSTCDGDMSGCSHTLTTKIFNSLASEWSDCLLLSDDQLMLPVHVLALSPCAIRINCNEHNLQQERLPLHLLKILSKQCPTALARQCASGMTVLQLSVSFRQFDIAYWLQSTFPSLNFLSANNIKLSSSISKQTMHSPTSNGGDVTDSEHSTSGQSEHSRTSKINRRDTYYSSDDEVTAKQELQSAFTTLAMLSMSSDSHEDSCRNKKQKTVNCE